MHGLEIELLPATFLKLSAISFGLFLNWSNSYRFLANHNYRQSCPPKCERGEKAIKNGRPLYLAAILPNIVV